MAIFEQGRSPENGAIWWFRGRGHRSVAHISPRRIRKSGALAAAFIALWLMAGGRAAGVDYKKGFAPEDMLPPMNRAVELSAKEGLRLLFQLMPRIRSHMAFQLRRRCPSEGTPEWWSADPSCRAKLGEPALETAISQAIDNLVELRTQSYGSLTSVYYEFSAVPAWGGLTVVTALRSRADPEVSIVYDFVRQNLYSISQVEQKYGPPARRSVDGESYTWFLYNRDTDEYTATIRFRFDPNYNEVRRVYIKLTKRN